jgi:hypothetical protein
VIITFEATSTNGSSSTLPPDAPRNSKDSRPKEIPNISTLIQLGQEVTPVAQLRFLLPHPTADPKVPSDATPQPPLKASMPRQQLPQLAATELSSVAEHRYAKLAISTNAAKSCCKFLFGEQHIYNDMGIGYIISHPITIAQLRYMHLTGIMPATDTEHTGYYITDYSNRPTHDNSLDEQQQIYIYTAYNKPPIPSNYEHNLYITLINNHNADNIDYSLHPMIIVP